MLLHVDKESCYFIPFGYTGSIMIRFFLTITSLLLLFFASVQIGSGNVPSFSLFKKDMAVDSLLITTSTEKEQVVDEKKQSPQEENDNLIAAQKIPVQLPTKPVIPPIAEEATKQIVLPPPLTTIQVKSVLGTLDATVVVNLTNKERTQQGLLPLYRNAKLDASAAVKAMDMLSKQYFAHDSPEGMTVEDLANGVNYEFVSLGENLAYGNFASDQEMIQGWMNSPGHRANMLSKKYTEIGVAVVKGTYQGREVWMGVQEFGKPRTACPQPDLELKDRIDRNNQDLENIGVDIAIMKKAIQNTDSTKDPTYNDQVDAVNALVAQYNKLVNDIKVWAAEYNKQVIVFNECANS